MFEKNSPLSRISVLLDVGRVDLSCDIRRTEPEHSSSPAETVDNV